MVRWLGQRDEFRCGPIALVNIMKWAGIKEFEGHRVNEKLAKKYLSTRCRTYRDGTFAKYFDPILHTLPGLRITTYRQPNRPAIKRCLNSGGIVLLDCPWWDKGKREHIWHYSLLVEVLGNGSHYVTINNLAGRAVSLIEGRAVARALKHARATAHFIWKDTE